MLFITPSAQHNAGCGIFCMVSDRHCLCTVSSLRGGGGGGNIVWASVCVNEFQFCPKFAFVSRIAEIVCVGI